jgi:hypothetical protein
VELQYVSWDAFGSAAAVAFDRPGVFGSRKAINPNVKVVTIVSRLRPIQSTYIPKDPLVKRSNRNYALFDFIHTQSRPIRPIRPMRDMGP